MLHSERTQHRIFICSQEVLDCGFVVGNASHEGNITTIAEYWINLRTSPLLADTTCMAWLP
jgi:hypothetical protein